MKILHSKHSRMVEGVDFTINDGRVCGVKTYCSAIQDQALHTFAFDPGARSAFAVNACRPKGGCTEAELAIRDFYNFRHSIAASELDLSIVRHFALIVFQWITFFPDSQVAKQLGVWLG
ncbi:hypothetical protein WP8W18C01_11580 [Pseudomonas putida]|uniref:Uncharacterized protein n=1 Tax=Pseudomonas putida TaxID=303 RepID=A0A6S5THR0_PSEPU|nr:hypothetical protein WP8W18C01_11580 [Pseudomonas putida]